jgi:hypothetical protein
MARHLTLNLMSGRTKVTQIGAGAVFCLQQTAPRSASRTPLLKKPSRS